MAQIDRLRDRLDDDNFSDAMLNELLTSAQDIIFSLRYPYSDSVWPTELDAKDFTNQIDIAVCLAGKLGAEGQVGHTENGISRTWDSGDLPEYILGRFTARPGVL